MVVHPATQATKPQPTEMTLGRPYRPASAATHKPPPKAGPVVPSSDTPAAARSPDAAAQPSGSGAGEDAVVAIAAAVELPTATLQKLMAPSRRGSSEYVETDGSSGPPAPLAAGAAAVKAQQREVREMLHARWDEGS